VEASLQERERSGAVMSTMMILAQVGVVLSSYSSFTATTTAAFQLHCLLKQKQHPMSLQEKE
jgi:hypothetical protein